MKTIHTADARLQSPWLMRAAVAAAILVSSGALAAEDASVDEALSWLGQHQEADGHWDTRAYGAGNKVDTACTSLALLAFIRAGNSEVAGSFQDNVERALAWLKSKQRHNGLVFDESDAGEHRGTGYPHGMAGLALAEAAGASKQPDTIKAAQMAIDYSINVQQAADGGFRYQPKAKGDLSVTAWYFQQFSAAKAAGLNVPNGSIDLAFQFLDSVIRKDANGISQYGYQAGKDANRRRNMIGAYARLFFGQHRDDAIATIEAVIQSDGYPSWGGVGEHVDLLYWHFGTLAASLTGGETAKKWNNALRKALIANQYSEGKDVGSWPIAGEFCMEWGQVGQTALACIALIHTSSMARASDGATPGTVQARKTAEANKATDGH